MAEPRRITVTCATCDGPIDFAEDGVSPRCAGCHHSGDGCMCRVPAELDWLSGALLAVQGSVERGRYRPRGVWVQQARKILSWLDEHGWQLIRLGGRHIVDFTPRAYGLQHPAACRPDLISCEYNRRLAAASEPAMKPGRYVMTIDPDGDEAYWPLPVGPDVSPTSVGGTDGTE